MAEGGQSSGTKRSLGDDNKKKSGKEKNTLTTMKEDEKGNIVTKHEILKGKLRYDMSNIVTRGFVPDDGLAPLDSYHLLPPIPTQFTSFTDAVFIPFSETTLDNCKEFRMLKACHMDGSGYAQNRSLLIFPEQFLDALPTGSKLSKIGRSKLMDVPDSCPVNVMSVFETGPRDRSCGSTCGTDFRCMPKKTDLRYKDVQGSRIRSTLDTSTLFQGTGANGTIWVHMTSSVVDDRPTQSPPRKGISPRRGFRHVSCQTDLSIPYRDGQVTCVNIKDLENFKDHVTWAEDPLSKKVQVFPDLMVILKPQLSCKQCLILLGPSKFDVTNSEFAARPALVVSRKGNHFYRHAVMLPLGYPPEFKSERREYRQVFLTYLGDQYSTLNSLLNERAVRRDKGPMLTDWAMQVTWDDLSKDPKMENSMNELSFLESTKVVVVEAYKVQPTEIEEGFDQLSVMGPAAAESKGEFDQLSVMGPPSAPL